MSLHQELVDQVQKIFREQWSERSGNVVPNSESLKLSNDAINLDATVLYADLAESTDLVDSYKKEFAAEIYKSYLYCAAKIIRSQGGIITAYDGDRIMAVFIGDIKNTSATKAALKINYARLEIINPALKNQYKNTDYEINHVIGVDTSELMASRTGIRGSNDIVWVGKAANHAAKLTSLPHTYATRITKEVYIKLNSEAKFDAHNNNMWEQVTWNSQNRVIYRSNYYWGIP